MKKLISIFAALAMVGALAAQKRKAPAKAPAKPAAVAAPAVPAAVTAPAPVVAAPAASGKGLGLSIEARGAWIQNHGTSTAKADGEYKATSVDYLLSNSSGFGGGLTIGYEIAKNLGIVASYDYRNITTREWKSTKTPIPAASGGGVIDSMSIKQTTNTSVLGIGLRPSVNLWGGNIYAGMGFALVLPYDNKAEISGTVSGNGGGLNGTGKLEVVNEWNLGLGVYGELGYNYAINDMLFVGVGVRGLIATSNNDGKKSTFTQSGDASSAIFNGSAASGLVTTVAGKVATAEYGASGDPAKINAYRSEGITDMTVSITVGARF